MRLPTAVLLLASATGVFQQSQDQFERQVRRQLAAVGDALKPKGFELTHQVFTGSLDEAASEVVTFRLQRGVTYAIVGVCDEDCGDVDLIVAEPSGRETGRDAEKDDTPVVEFRADKTGEYRVKVEMAECADEPCVYGIGVFATEIDEFDRQVRAQLENATRELGREGFALTHQIFTGALRESQSEDVVFELQAGGTYLILGVCDNDCKDFDLELLDSNGRRIDRDEGDDDVPVVAVSPARRERYTVRATMASCGDNPCRFGLGAVRK